MQRSHMSGEGDGFHDEDDSHHDELQSLRSQVFSLELELSSKKNSNNNTSNNNNNNNSDSNYRNNKSGTSRIVNTVRSRAAANPFKAFTIVMLFVAAVVTVGVLASTASKTNVPTKLPAPLDATQDNPPPPGVVATQPPVKDPDAGQGAVTGDWLTVTGICLNKGDPETELATAVARGVEVAADIAAKVGSRKYPAPEQCSPTLLSGVEASGMIEKKCRVGISLTPWQQFCSFSKLTVHNVGLHTIWLDGFAKEINRERALENPNEGQPSIIGIKIGGENGHCKDYEKLLYFPNEAHPDAAQSHGVNTKKVLENPKLLCDEVFETSLFPDEEQTAFGTQWGLESDPLSFDMTVPDYLDAALELRGLTNEIKDVVFLMGQDNVLPRHGPVTMATTRYVEFQLDWKGVWASDSVNLDYEIDLMRKLGHTCYFAGQDKLWRITDCWMKHYCFKSWARIACVNRVLAPETAETMEQLFLSTIGVI